MRAQRVPSWSAGVANPDNITATQMRTPEFTAPVGVRAGRFEGEGRENREMAYGE